MSLFSIYVINVPNQLEVEVTIKGGDLAHCLSNFIDIVRITNIVDSKRRFVFRTTKRRVLTLLFAKSNEFERVSTNFDKQAYFEI